MEGKIMKVMPKICTELGLDYETMTEEEIADIVDKLTAKVPKAEKFLERNRGSLARFANILMRRKDISLSLGIGYESYTDHKSIRLELSWGEIYRYTEVQWYIILRFKAAHECQHNKSTTTKAFVKAQDTCVEIWNKKAESDGIELAERRLKKIAHFLVNSVEDGRIERILIGENPGLRKGQMWYRWECYDKYEVKLKKKEEEDLKVILNMILDIATLGVRGKGFEEAYTCRPKVLEVVRNCEIFIEKGCSAVRCAGIISPCGEMAKLLYPWIAKAMQMSDMDKFFDMLEEMMSQMTDGGEPGEPGSSVADDSEEEIGDASTMASAPLKELMEEAAAKASSGKGTPSEDSTQKESRVSSDKSDEESEKGSDGQDGASGADGEEESGGNPDGTKAKESDGTSGEVDDREPEGKAGSLKDSMRKALRDSMKNIITEIEADCEKAAMRQIASEATPQKAKTDRKEKTSTGTDISETDLEDVCEGYRRDSGHEIPFRIANNERYRRNKYTSSTCSSIGRQLHRQIEQMFRTKTTETQRQQTSGKLDIRRLSKLSYGSGEVFLKKGMPYIPDVACYILKDGSGSMWSDGKNRNCCEALGGIEEGMKGLIPLRIVDFSEDFGSPCVRHTVIKDWMEERKDFNYSWSFYESGGGEEGNNFDGFSIRVATRELLTRPEQHKLLIVMSDGAPWSSLCNHSHGAVDVRNAVEEARKAGIYVVSIFFGNEDFLETEKKTYEHMYQKNFFGATPENLVGELSRHLKKFIKAY